MRSCMRSCNVDLVLFKGVNYGRIYAMSECEVHCIQLKKYLLCTNVRVDLTRVKCLRD